MAWHLGGKPMSKERRDAVIADVDRRIAERATFQAGDQLFWYRTFRNEPAWYTLVFFVRYAGRTRALVTESSGQERRVSVESLSRDRGW